MKRYGHLFEQVVSFENLILAVKKTCRGQKRNPNIANLYFHMETEVLKLQKELVLESYQPKKYRVFEIYEPKQRLICAAEVRDRVVHHAICQILEPIFEKILIYDTYACRPDKGTHLAIKRVEKLVRQAKYFLKCDIRKYFASIDHQILKTLLSSKLKDKKLLLLLEKIIEHQVPNGDKGKGLPIGNLTSQHFANFYLGELDHHVKEQLRVKSYVRYMDDFILLADDKQDLHCWLAEIRSFLRQKLDLELKEEATRIDGVSNGLPFLGFRIFPAITRVMREKLTRFCHKVSNYEEAYLTGKITETQLAESVSSMVSHLQHADTVRVRKKIFEKSLRLG